VPPPPASAIISSGVLCESVNIVHTNCLCLVKPGMGHAAVYLRLLV